MPKEVGEVFKVTLIWLDLIEYFLDFVNLDMLWLSDFSLTLSLISKLNCFVIFELGPILIGSLPSDDLNKFRAIIVKLIHVECRLILSHCFRVKELLVKN